VYGVQLNAREDAWMLRGSARWIKADFSVSIALLNNYSGAPSDIHRASRSLEASFPFPDAAFAFDAEGTRDDARSGRKSSGGELESA